MHFLLFGSPSVCFHCLAIMTRGCSLFCWHCLLDYFAILMLHLSWLIVLLRFGLVPRCFFCLVVSLCSSFIWSFASAPSQFGIFRRFYFRFTISLFCCSLCCPLVCCFGFLSSHSLLHCSIQLLLGPLFRCSAVSLPPFAVLLFYCFIPFSVWPGFAFLCCSLLHCFGILLCCLILAAMFLQETVSWLP